MNTLVTLLIVLVVFALVWYIIDMTPLTPQWRIIVKIIVALILIVYLVTHYLGANINLFIIIKTLTP